MGERFRHHGAPGRSLVGTTGVAKTLGQFSSPPENLQPRGGGTFCKDDVRQTSSRSGRGSPGYLGEPVDGPGPVYCGIQKLPCDGLPQAVIAPAPMGE